MAEIDNSLRFFLFNSLRFCSFFLSDSALRCLAKAATVTAYSCSFVIALLFLSVAEAEPSAPLVFLAASAARSNSVDTLSSLGSIVGNEKERERPSRNAISGSNRDAVLVPSAGEGNPLLGSVAGRYQGDKYGGEYGEP